MNSSSPTNQVAPAQTPFSLSWPKHLFHATPAWISTSSSVCMHSREHSWPSHGRASCAYSTAVLLLHGRAPTSTVHTPITPLPRQNTTVTPIIIRSHQYPPRPLPTRRSPWLCEPRSSHLSFSGSFHFLFSPSHSMLYVLMHGSMMCVSNVCMYVRPVSFIYVCAFKWRVYATMRAWSVF